MLYTPKIKAVLSQHYEVAPVCKAKVGEAATSSAPSTADADLAALLLLEASLSPWIQFFLAH